MARVRFVKDTESKIKEEPVADGSIYVSSDTGKMFVDNGNEREQIGISYTLSKSGNSIVLTGDDGSTSTVVDANTTYGAMVGANISTAGAAGLVPAPAAGKQTNFLRGDGTWAVPANATYSDMTGASSDAAGKSGLVPAPSAGAANRYLRSDGTWQVPPDTNTTYTLSSFGITATATELNYMDGVTSNVQTQLNGKASSSHTHNLASNSASGFLPQLSGNTSQYLRGDGTWAYATVPDNSITSEKIAADAVNSSKIATNAVGNTKIASSAVTLPKLGADVGTVAVQSSTPTDSHVKLWIQI